METESIKEKIERYKIKADLFLKSKIKTFIKDTLDNYYFCYIIFAGDECIYVQHFKGKKKYEKERIFYVDIVKFVEYKEDIKKEIEDDRNKTI